MILLIGIGSSAFAQKAPTPAPTTTPTATTTPARPVISDSQQLAYFQAEASFEEALNARTAATKSINDTCTKNFKPFINKGVITCGDLPQVPNKPVDKPVGK